MLYPWGSKGRKFDIKRVDKVQISTVRRFEGLALRQTLGHDNVLEWCWDILRLRFQCPILIHVILHS